MSNRHDRLREADDAVYRRLLDAEHALRRLHDALVVADADVDALGVDNPSDVFIEARADRALVLADWSVEVGDMLDRLDVVDRGMALEHLRARIFDAEG